MRIHSPEGPVGSAPVQLAEAPRVLSGSRLALLDNRKPNAAALLGGLGAELGRRTGVSFDEVVAKENAATAAADELLRRLASEADLIVSAAAD